MFWKVFHTSCETLPELISFHCLLLCRGRHHLKVSPYPTLYRTVIIIAAQVPCALKILSPQFSLKALSSGKRENSEFEPFPWKKDLPSVLLGEVLFVFF